MKMVYPVALAHQTSKAISARFQFLLALPVAQEFATMVDNVPDHLMVSTSAPALQITQEPTVKQSTPQQQFQLELAAERNAVTMEDSVLTTTVKTLALVLLVTKATNARLQFQTKLHVAQRYATMELSVTITTVITPALVPQDTKEISVKT